MRENLMSGLGRGSRKRGSPPRLLPTSLRSRRWRRPGRARRRCRSGAGPIVFVGFSFAKLRGTCEVCGFALVTVAVYS